VADGTEMMTIVFDTMFDGIARRSAVRGAAE
jgi:hypothetical protein